MSGSLTVFRIRGIPVRVHVSRVGLCGQAPSNRPQFARFLVEAGIDSMSVSPDTFLRVRRHVAAAEAGGAREMRDA